METLLIHILKSTALAILFLGCYLVFLRKETFFNSNRIYLLAGIFASLLLPFVKFTKVVWIKSQPVLYGQFNVIETSAQEAMEPFNWFAVLYTIYLLGITFFTLRFMVQLWTINRIKKKSVVFKEDGIKHVRSQKQLSPFSFFKNIFYCPTQFEQDELEAILTHEKAHARQYHSFDVLFMQLVCIILWFHPLVWLYNYFIKQNLEFQADSLALKKVADKKQYQYIMLKQAVGHGKLMVASAFFNSLTKKRITMLHQKKSKKTNILKSLLILPFLGLFLVAFAVKTEYKELPENTTVATAKDRSFKSITHKTTNNGQLVQVKEEPKTNKDNSKSKPAQKGQIAYKDKSIELIINKNTTNEELEKMKSDLAKDDIDLSYTTVRNDDREIIDISIDVSGGGENGSSFRNSHSSSDSEHGISPLIISIDLENKSASIMTKGDHKSNIKKIKTSSNTTWISVDDDNQEVIIKQENGIHKIIVDGEEVDVDHLDDDTIEIDLDGKGKRKSKRNSVKVRHSKSGDMDSNVFILKDSDSDSDIEVISESAGFFFIDTDGGKEPLYIIDGKESTKEDVKKISPDKIERIEVLKGEAAKKKYGKKAKNGVVEITTKK